MYYNADKSCMTILVANSKNEPTSFDFRVLDPSISSMINMTVLFENRKIQMKSGTLQDIIMGYGTHAYEYCSYSSDIILPGNLIKNPSFEQQSNVGMADSMWVFSSTPENTGIIDYSNVWDGYYSQRLIHAGGANQTIKLESYIVAVPSFVNYSLSFEAYADTQTTIEVSSSCLTTNSYSLHPNGWNNISIDFYLDNPAQCSFTITLSEKATIWIDALQLVPA